MLIKLIKYDFKATSKLLLLIHAFFCMLCLFVFLLFRFFNFDSSSIVKSLIIVFLALYAMATVFSTYTIHIARFYKNLFTEEGYLTHTLPVKPYQHFLSKGFTFLVWAIVDAVMVFGMFLFLLDEYAPISMILKLIAVQFDATRLGVLLYLCGYLLLGLLLVILMFYLCICIGSLFSPHKIFASIIAYIVLYTISQLLSVLVLLLTPTGRSILHTTNSSILPTELLPFFNIMGILSLILIGCYTIGSLWILNKRINLN